MVVGVDDFVMDVVGGLRFLVVNTLQRLNHLLNVLSVVKHCKPFDIFKHKDLWSFLVNLANNVIDNSSSTLFIFESLAISSHRKWLTRKSRHVQIHFVH